MKSRGWLKGQLIVRAFADPFLRRHLAVVERSIGPGAAVVRSARDGAGFVRRKEGSKLLRDLVRAVDVLKRLVDEQWVAFRVRCDNPLRLCCENIVVVCTVLSVSGALSSHCSQLSPILSQFRAILGRLRPSLGQFRTSSRHMSMHPPPVALSVPMITSNLSSSIQRASCHCKLMESAADCL